MPSSVPVMETARLLLFVCAMRAGQEELAIFGRTLPWISIDWMTPARSHPWFLQLPWGRVLTLRHYWAFCWLLAWRYSCCLSAFSSAIDDVQQLKFLLPQVQGLCRKWLFSISEITDEKLNESLPEAQRSIKFGNMPSYREEKRKKKCNKRIYGALNRITEADERDSASLR